MSSVNSFITRYVQVTFTVTSLVRRIGMSTAPHSEKYFCVVGHDTIPMNNVDLLLWFTGILWHQASNQKLKSGLL